MAPTAPTEADSVGVAIPARMEPRTATIRASAGTSATTTFFGRSRRSAALIFSAGAACGRKIATRGIKQKLIFKRIEDGLLAFFRAEAQKELNLVR